MLICVRRHAACPLSPRKLEEMMVERGVAVDHATVHRWALKVLPVTLKQRPRSDGNAVHDGLKYARLVMKNIW
jgi:transposase-like protein